MYLVPSAMTRKSQIHYVRRWRTGRWRDDSADISGNVKVIEQLDWCQRQELCQRWAYVLPHLEYCCPLLLGISKALKNNIERTNHYAIKTLLNLGNSATYDFCLAMADMDKLEQRRTLQSLILFFKCFKLDGPNYISQFFTPRLTKYNLRDSGLNFVQPPDITALSCTTPIYT